MKSKEELTEIARKNGAKSKGPKTAPGKEQSKRNAITHGDRATALKLLVPPHSAILAYENPREFYKLYDTNIAKYLPLDDHAHRPIRCCPRQWGKSSTISIKALHYALQNPKFEILVLSDSEDHAAVAHNQSSGVGYTANLVIVDEAAVVDDQVLS